MNNPLALTPEQFAEMIRDSKPYLIELENHVQGVSYGTVEVKIEVRAGVVEKMNFFNSKTWLRDKTKKEDQCKSQKLDPNSRT